MENYFQELINCQKASRKISRLGDNELNSILLKIAELLEKRRVEILAANQIDAAKLQDNNPRKDRLLLDDSRIDSLINGVYEVADLPSPIGLLLRSAQMENGLLIEKRSVPLGVVGVIFESRPNVTIDVASLCLKSGNAVVLRGGSEAHHSNAILVKIIKEALQVLDFPSDAVCLLPSEREYVHILLSANKYVDVIIPRGSQELINFVRKESTIPVIETGAGVCHTYVSKFANVAMAADIVVNAKTSRPSVCNALDTIIVDEQVAASLFEKLQDRFAAFKVELRADEKAYQLLSKSNYPFLQKATESDFGKEYLDFACSIKVLNNVNDALEHIYEYSSKHSEAIVTEDAQEAVRFLNEVDAAAVYHNASTRFTDGNCFGLGAEIGISTQKLHARGPFALEKLVTEKWIVKGNGQIRN
jgi:glutamate-5-semialdehyde dehydrogenase